MTVIIKTNAEIEKIRHTGKLVAELLEMIGEHVKIGVTTEKLDSICHDYIINQQHAIPALVNYRGYPKTICTSVNHQICHAIPGSKVLKNGDILNIDVTIQKDGYFADASKMFILGTASILAKRLVQVAHECLFLGIAQVKPGIKLGTIGNVIEAHANQYGYSVVREYCGHGIGKEIHEDPNVLHFKSSAPDSEIILQPNMVFTIEPMINAGSYHTKKMNDGWTVVTRDHSLSAQWEHTILVTNDGYEILTLREEERKIMN
jgi:methionyl aminopeptidase